jgi:hypothetical protein
MVTIRMEGLANLRAKMQMLANLAGKTINDELKTYARGFVREIIKITPPAMGGAGAKKNQGRGEGAVMRDVAKVYLSAGRAYKEIRESLGDATAKVFWAAYKENNTQAAEAILRRVGGKFAAVKMGAFDGGAAHARLRNSRGRISKERPEQLPTSGTGYEDYMNRRVKNVGILASGWIAAARLVGERVPKYASRHPGNGSARVNARKSGDTYHFHNAVDYASQNDLDRRGRWVLAKQERKLITRIRYAVLHAASRANAA